MTAAAKLAGLLHPLLGGELPVRIRAWDGSEAGPADAPVLQLTSRRALRRLLWHPDELGIAQAYITGELDVPGGAAELADGPAPGLAARPGRQQGRPDQLDAEQKLAAAAARGPARRARAGGRPSPASQAKLTGTLHTQARDRAAIAHHYDLSNEFYALILDPSMAYSSAYYDRPGLQSGPGPAGQTRPDLPQAGAATGHAAAGRRLRLGLAEPARRRALRRAGDRGHHLAPAARVRQQADRRTQPRRPGRGPGAGLPGAVASPPSTRSVRSRWASTSASTTTRPTPPPCSATCKPTGRLLLQQMSRRADAAPGGGAFIESYIAPDMHMRPLGETIGFLERAGFEIRDVQALREHYVRTVQDWLDTFEGTVRRRGGHGGRGDGPGLAALPGRRWPELRRGPDGRRPDPGGAAVRPRRFGDAGDPGLGSFVRLADGQRIRRGSVRRQPAAGGRRRCCWCWC